MILITDKLEELIRKCEQEGRSRPQFQDDCVNILVTLCTCPNAPRSSFLFENLSSRSNALGGELVLHPKIAQHIRRAPSSGDIRENWKYRQLASIHFSAEQFVSAFFLKPGMKTRKQFFAEQHNSDMEGLPEPFFAMMTREVERRAELTLVRRQYKKAFEWPLDQLLAKSLESVLLRRFGVPKANPFDGKDAWAIVNGSFSSVFDRAAMFARGDKERDKRIVSYVPIFKELVLAYFPKAFLGTYEALSRYLSESDVLEDARRGVSILSHQESRRRYTKTPKSIAIAERSLLHMASLTVPIVFGSSMPHDGMTCLDVDTNAGVPTGALYGHFVEDLVQEDERSFFEKMFAEELFGPNNECDDSSFERLKRNLSDDKSNISLLMQRVVDRTIRLSVACIESEKKKHGTT